MSIKTALLAVEAMISAGCDLSSIIDALDCVDSIEALETADTIPCPPPKGGAL